MTTPAQPGTPDRDHTWEVFQRRKAEDSLTHVGTVHAGDERTALLLARETHFRHNEGIDYAVVRSDQVHWLADPSLLEHEVDMSYRLQSGYSGFREKRERAREAADERGRGHLRDQPRPGAGGSTKGRSSQTTSKRMPRKGS